MSRVWCPLKVFKQQCLCVRCLDGGGDGDGAQGMETMVEVMEVEGIIGVVVTGSLRNSSKGGNYNSITSPYISPWSEKIPPNTIIFQRGETKLVRKLIPLGNSLFR